MNVNETSPNWNIFVCTLYMPSGVRMDSSLFNMQIFGTNATSEKFNLNEIGLLPDELANIDKESQVFKSGKHLPDIGRPRKIKIGINKGVIDSVHLDKVRQTFFNFA